MKQLTEKLNQRFCKDMNISISLYKDPYFTLRLDLYSRTLYPGMNVAYSSYLFMLTSFESEQDYFEYYTSVKERAINSIKESDGYKRFNEEDMNTYSIAGFLTSLPKQDIFKPTFDKKKFMSFDMKKANFSSLHQYDSMMFSGFDTWEGFIGSFTNCTHIKNSKYIREVILGNCNPKRHITYEKYIMSKILEGLLAVDPSLKDSIVFFSNDEVIFDVTNKDNNDIEVLKNLMNRCLEQSKFSIELKSSLFDLYYIPELDGYIEVIWMTDKQRALVPKKINSFMMPFLCRALLGEEVRSEDTVFIHPNHRFLSKFVEYPEVNLPEEVVSAFHEYLTID